MADMALTQVILGMRPFVLIELDEDPADGELLLNVKAGGGVPEDGISKVAYLLLTQIPGKDNPLTKGFMEFLAEKPRYRQVVAELAEHIGIPFPDGD